MLRYTKHIILLQTALLIVAFFFPLCANHTHTHNPRSDANAALISTDKRLVCLHALNNHIPEVMT